jgi:hypothetical protein
MGGFVVDPRVVSRVEREKFTVLNPWSDSFLTEISAECIPVIPLVGGDRFDLVQISFHTCQPIRESCGCVIEQCISSTKLAEQSIKAFVFTEVKV